MEQSAICFVWQQLLMIHFQLDIKKCDNSLDRECHCIPATVVPYTNQLHVDAMKFPPHSLHLLTSHSHSQLFCKKSLRNALPPQRIHKYYSRNYFKYQTPDTSTSDYGLCLMTLLIVNSIVIASVFMVTTCFIPMNFLELQKHTKPPLHLHVLSKKTPQPSENCQNMCGLWFTSGGICNLHISDTNARTYLLTHS